MTTRSASTLQVMAQYTLDIPKMYWQWLVCKEAQYAGTSALAGRAAGSGSSTSAEVLAEVVAPAPAPCWPSPPGQAAGVELAPSAATAGAGTSSSSGLSVLGPCSLFGSRLKPTWSK
eukprot:CAMPEP_0179118994 /NCGR_PEP_ID=MMETSP0796-20121207/55996_1 /TAXON_ID=73915 /ORGANISM="Pyrodinium bahamense, Strain pbaha01" /LENGTH=116 /DNA_ID=CAMNT_0020817481 /DNA_START=162 /DNA_END=512 /DNA_ORIENTATION=+